jgi:cysteinyl-tRNA synthetase
MLRGMVLELARVAEGGLADPRERLAPLVEVLLEGRDAARQEGDFALADALRDRLNAAGVTVQDTFQGSRWTMR